MRESGLRKKTASNLLKLSTNSKLAVALFIYLISLVTPEKNYSQNFPSTAHPNAALTENFFSKENFFVTPTLSAGTMVEFRQIYALNISFCGSYLNSEEKIFPLLGFSYDLYFKLYRRNPPTTFTPIAGIKFLKQWKIRSGDSEFQRSILNDLSNWRSQLLAGIDIAPSKAVSLKILGGMNVMIGPREYYPNAISPCVMVIGEL